MEHFSKALADNGYKVTILTRGERGQKENEVINNVMIKRIFLPDVPEKRKSAVVYIKDVVDCLNKGNFSVVFLHAGCRYFALIKLLTSSKAKFVYHITSHPVSLSSSRFHFFKYKFIVFLQCLCMDKIMIISEELKQHWVGLRSFKKTVVVPIGVDKKTVFPIGSQEKLAIRKQLKIPEGHSLLVYCGVISPLRRLDLMIKAFAHVVNKIKPVSLLIVGDGPELPEIRELAKKLNIDDSVIFLGQVSHQETAKFLAASDVGLAYVPITESYTYNPPLKTFECLAAGLPTIATKTVSNSRIIKNGYNGVLAGDQPYELAEVIIDLLKDDELQKKIRDKARESIMEYDFTYITKNKLIPLIKQLMR